LGRREKSRVRGKGEMIMMKSVFLDRGYHAVHGGGETNAEVTGF